MKMNEYLEKNKIINLLEHNDKVYHYADSEKENIVYGTVQTLCKVILEEESADVQPLKRGTWSDQALFDDGFGGFRVGFICSCCKQYVPVKGNFCSNCGAVMRGEIESFHNAKIALNQQREKVIYNE